VEKISCISVQKAMACYNKKRMSGELSEGYIVEAVAAI
jgi:hypothetical protein